MICWQPTAVSAATSNKLTFPFVRKKTKTTSSSTNVSIVDKIETIEVVNAIDAVRKLPVVVCLCAQYEMGAPGDYTKGKETAASKQLLLVDDAKNRLTWFRQSLAELVRQLPVIKLRCGKSQSNSSNTSSGSTRLSTSSASATAGPLIIAFPKNIGCGLAGGDLASYEAELDNFAAAVASQNCIVWQVSLVSLE